MSATQQSPIRWASNESLEKRMTRAKVAVGLASFTSIISFIAALVPVLKGGRMNVVFLGSGVVFLAVAIANAKRIRSAKGGPPVA